MSELFSSLKIAGSGLSVFRRKMNVAAENIANAETTKTKEGTPYKRKSVVISAKDKKSTFSRELNDAVKTMNVTNKRHIPLQPIRRFNSVEISHANATESVDPNEEFRMIYDPAHPDANADGFVAMPNIDPLMEMVEMMTAARAYEANIQSIDTIKDMSSKAMDI